MTDIIVLYFITGMNYSGEINGDNIEFCRNHEYVLCKLILLFLNDNKKKIKKKNRMHI